MQQTLNGKKWFELLDTISGNPTYDGPPTNPAVLADELKELHALIEYRGGVLAEAMAQRSGPLSYFRGVLEFSPGTHRATFLLALAAFHVAEFQDMYWKLHFKRARPSRIDPRLLPPTEVPGHASFPSGHACEAMLMALVLEQILPEAIVQDSSGTVKAEQGPLRLLARRIARNREVLGLHFRTDTQCGFKIAARSLQLFLQCPLVRGTGTTADGAERAQANMSPGGAWPAEPVNPGGTTIYADGLLARARKEWL